MWERLTFDEPTIYTITVVSLVVLSTVGVVVGGAQQQSLTSPAADETEFKVTDDGTRYIIHPTQLRQGCPGGTDCIPSIDDPQFQSAAQADWLADEDLVIGVEINGETRAYPLRILTVHEIVNDEVGGRPIAVTYCPLCRSGLVFDRRVNGTTLTFGVSGKLLNANLVMYDRQTKTYWSQLNGSAIVGPLVPRQLTILPNTITTWAKWHEAHPETTVLSRDTGIYHKSNYASDPYAGYANSDRVGFGVNEVDSRLHPKTVVYGVTIGNTSRAYPEPIVTEADVVNDVVEGVPVAVVEDQTTGGVRVFVRRVDNETLRFSLEDGQLVDQTGVRWRFDGTAMAGPHEGTTLERLNSHGIYWFAWSEFHPETELYDR
ncbi:MAG: DUF3179 domain-containing protein [Halobacteriales archaeon]